MTKLEAFKLEAFKNFFAEKRYHSFDMSRTEAKLFAEDIDVLLEVVESIRLYAQHWFTKEADRWVLTGDTNYVYKIEQLLAFFKRLEEEDF